MYYILFSLSYKTPTQKDLNWNLFYSPFETDHVPNIYTNNCMHVTPLLCFSLFVFGSNKKFHDGVVDELVVI